MIKLVLVRHGQSIWNLENRFTGWTDVPLSEQGVKEAKEAGMILKKQGFTFDLAFTSVLKRAEDTLDYILKEMNLRVTTEPGRYFVAESGALIMKVEYIKEELGRKYVILNGGMNDYIRVAMYDAYNEIYPLVKKDNVADTQFRAKKLFLL